MLLDVNTIFSIEKAGISFIANVRCPWGCKTIWFTPEQVVTFVADQDQAIADSLGVTKAQYLEWLEAWGMARCGARTAKGTRCKNLIRGSMQFEIEHWLELDGTYCSVHQRDTGGKAGAAV